MALTPQNNDAFFREVSEELRRDRMTDFMTRYGKILGVVIVVGLIALGGWLWWQHDQATKAGADGEALSQVLRDVSEGKSDGATAKLDALAKSDRAGYRAASQLTLADLALEKNDEKGAIARFKAVAADESVGQPYRDVALIRQTALEYDSLKPQDVIARLKGLAVAGNPWFGSAGEMVAVAHLRLNQNAEAGKLFAAIAKDTQVPESLRSRAVQMAGVLGVDAVPADAPAAAGGDRKE